MTGEGPRDYNREYCRGASGPLQVRIGLDREKGTVTRFMIQLEYHHDGDWLRTNQKPKGPIFCEHEPADIRKFREAGYRAGKAKESIDAGIAEVRRRLGEDDNGRVGLLISDRCQHFVREFLGYKEAHIGTSQAEDHCLDRLRYAVMG